MFGGELNTILVFNKFTQKLTHMLSSDFGQLKILINFLNCTSQKPLK